MGIILLPFISIILYYPFLFKLSQVEYMVEITIKNERPGGTGAVDNKREVT
jgi:hypothetical protein